MMTHISTQDRESLNKMMGDALLYDDVREALLYQQTRKQLISQYDFSHGLAEVILRIDDVSQLDEFAEKLYYSPPHLLQ